MEMEEAFTTMYSKADTNNEIDFVGKKVVGESGRDLIITKIMQVLFTKSYVVVHGYGEAAE